MDEADLRAEIKADLDRNSAELIQDHLGRCHKSVQALPPPLPSTSTLTDSRRQASTLALRSQHGRKPSRLSITIRTLIAV